MSYFLIAPGGHTLPLNAKSLVVGTDASADLPVPAEFELAARHFLLEQTEGGHRVELLEPTGILAVNGMPIRESKLSPGDVIHAGKLELTYQSEKTAEESPEPPPLEESLPRSSYRMPSPPELPEQDLASEPQAPSAEVGAMPPPILQPPELPPVDGAVAAPRGIYRIPTQEEAAALTASEADQNGIAGMNNKKGLGSMQKVANAEQWQKNHLSELEAQQDLPQGMFMGLLVGVVLAVPFAYVADMPLLNGFIGKSRFYVYGVIFGSMGYLVGKAVRKFGHGITRKFDYAAAFCALCTALLMEYMRIELFHSQLDVETLVESSEPVTGPDYSIMFNVYALITYGVAMAGAFKASTQWSLKPKK